MEFEKIESSPVTVTKSSNSNQSMVKQTTLSAGKTNQVGTVVLYGIPIVSLVIENQERLCLAQISNTLLKHYSYNEIHNRRVALGITCVQCTPVQLEILRRAGAMPVSSRRCGMITRREAERLCKSFLGDNSPPRLPDDFAFSVHHECAWGCRGAFLPSRYNSSRAKCIKCTYCGLFFSPNKFIFHSHRTGANDKYVQPDAANFNSWRRHMKLSGHPPDEIVHAWEDVKAMFNGGTRKRVLSHPSPSNPSKTAKHAKVTGSTSPVQSEPASTLSASSPVIPAPRVPTFASMPIPLSRNFMDYIWQTQTQAKPRLDPFATFSSGAYSSLPWLKRSAAPMLFPSVNTNESLLNLSSNSALYHHSAFRPVQGYPLLSTSGNHARSDLITSSISKTEASDDDGDVDDDDDDDREVDIETTDDNVIVDNISSSGGESLNDDRWSPKSEADKSNAISPSTDSKFSSALSPLNLSPKNDLANATRTVPPLPIKLTTTDKLWTISRITQPNSPYPPNCSKAHSMDSVHSTESLNTRPSGTGSPESCCEVVKRYSPSYYPLALDSPKKRCFERNVVNNVDGTVLDCSICDNRNNNSSQSQIQDSNKDALVA